MLLVTSAVVIGVRAFNERRDLAANLPGLFAWVEGGGTVISPEEFGTWMGVADLMREEARERIVAHFEVFAKWMRDKQGVNPELVIREGDAVAEILPGAVSPEATETNIVFVDVEAVERRGKYLLLYDPLDGSANIDVLRAGDPGNIYRPDPLPKALDDAMMALAESGGAIQLQPSDPWVSAGGGDRFVLVDPPNKHIMTYEYKGKSWEVKSVRNLEVDMIARYVERLMQPAH